MLLHISERMAKDLLLVIGDLRLVICDLDDESVLDADDAAGGISHGLLVGNDDCGYAFGIELLEDIHHFDGRFGVECSGGFVGKEDLGFADDSSRDSHTLTLTA